MSKRIFALLMGMVMAVSLAACAVDSNQDKGSGADPSNAVSDEGKQQEDPFVKFENGLKDLGLEVTQKIETAAGMIGGIKGQKYTIGDYKIELYQFDAESDAYKQAEQKGAVTMEGFGDFPVYAHNGMIMMKDSSIPQSVIDLFQTL